MNELEDILNYLETTSLEPHDDYTSEFTYKNQKLLWNYIKQLKEQLELSEKARKEASHIVENNFLESTIESYVCLKTKDYLKLKKVLDIDKGE